MVALTIGVLAVLSYTYFGYPVLIALCARLFPFRLQPEQGFEPTVSAVIPVYNAAPYVRGKLDSLLAQDHPAHKLEILVCSDASNDGTDEILQEYARRHPRIRLFRSKVREGKPAAVNRLLREATGSVLLMTDIRQPLAPDAVRALVRPLADRRVGCVSGNLILRGMTGAGFYWRYESSIRRSEGSFRSMVGVTGPIYAVRRRDMPQLPSDVILDDMWVPMRLRLAGRVIAFEPRAEAYDDAFEDTREVGRKVRTLAGNYQLLARMPRLLLPFANPSWFETFSHKLLRLAAPWLLALLLISSIAAAPAAPVLWGLVVAQLVVYGSAALGPRAGRIAAIARTFVVLNYAAVAGLFRYVRGRQQVAW
jgi:cellulose synthase/poly-beta-1,6-N-acetylglucosamine synthase-like glycosyltransferase